MKHTYDSYRAVLFDLDGTMVDTVPDIAAAANRMLEELGAFKLSFKTVRDFIGKGVPNLVRRTLEAGNLSERVDEGVAQTMFYAHYRNTNGHYGRVFPGVLEGLKALQQADYRLACVTSKPLAFTEPLLDTTGLVAFFDTVVAGDSLPVMKPAPEPLLHACAQMQIAPTAAVMVGDSGVDIAAASAAGMPVYIVRYGYSGPEGCRGMECDGLIDSFDELLGLLRLPTLSA